VCVLLFSWRIKIINKRFRHIPYKQLSLLTYSEVNPWVVDSKIQPVHVILTVVLSESRIIIVVIIIIVIIMLKLRSPTLTVTSVLLRVICSWCIVNFHLHARKSIFLPYLKIPSPSIPDLSTSACRKQRWIDGRTSSSRYAAHLHDNRLYSDFSSFCYIFVIIDS